MGKPYDEQNIFADIAVKGSNDSVGRSYNMGLIDYCRGWRNHKDKHAYRHYSCYLLEECDNDLVYEEFGALVFSDFLAMKALAIESYFLVLDDVNRFLNAAKTRNDVSQYGRTLRLHSELWERGVSVVEAGVAIVCARYGHVQEAVANTWQLQDMKEIFSVLQSIIKVVDNDSIEAIQIVADAMLECAKKMDNEGTRAHHIHRILYSVRPKNSDLALSLVPKCREIVDTISDEFQHLVSSLLLTQQVAPLDLDIAEDISKAVTGGYFSGEESDVLLALAAIGRNGEPQAKRIERLKRLLQRAESLESAKTRLSAVSGLLLELLCEQPSNQSLNSWIQTISPYLSNTEDSELLEVINELLCPEPIRVNNASCPYQGEGEIGTLGARTVLDGVQLIHGLKEDSAALFENLVSILFDRIKGIEDKGKQKSALKLLTGLLCQLASTIDKVLSVRILNCLESCLTFYEEMYSTALYMMQVAAAWYTSGLYDKGEELLFSCLKKIEESTNFVSDEETSKKEKDSELSDSLFTQMASTFFNITDESIDESDKDNFEKQKVQDVLVHVLVAIPFERRIPILEKVEGYLDIGKDSINSDTLAMMMSAVGESDMDYAIQLASKIKEEAQRLEAYYILAKVAAENNSNTAVKIIDMFSKDECSGDPEESYSSYEQINNIMSFNVSEASNRILLKPDNEEKMNASMKLMNYINGVEDVYCLDLSINGYRKQMECAEDKSDNSEISECFLKNLNERLDSWNRDTVTVVVPILLPFLSELVNNGEILDVIILKILGKARLDEEAFLTDMLSLIDDIDIRKQALSIIAAQAPIDILNHNIFDNQSFKKKVYSAETRAAVTLRKVLAELPCLPEANSTSEEYEDASASCATKSIELLLNSIGILKLANPNCGKNIVTEIMSLLHQATRCESGMYSSLFQSQNESEGIDEEEAGKLVGKFVASIYHSPQDMEEVAKFVTDGNDECGLPPIIGQEDVLFQSSEACIFLENLFNEMPGDIDSGSHFVEDCLSTLMDSYYDIEDCIIELSQLAEKLSATKHGICKHICESVISLCEEHAKSNDDVKSLLLFLRFYFASQQLPLEYLSDSTQWIRQSLKELIKMTSTHGVCDEFFMSLTRIGYILGRININKQGNKNILERIDSCIGSLLLGLAEFECQAMITTLTKGPKEAFTKTAISYVVQLDSDLEFIEKILASDDDLKQNVSEDVNRRITLACNLHSFLMQADDGEDEGTNVAAYLGVVAGIAWKLGLDKSDEKKNEIIEVMCQLAQQADMSDLEDEDSPFKLNEVYQYELFVRSLCKAEKEKALCFVEALAKNNDDIGDLGLFDELLLQEPQWIFLNIGRVYKEQTGEKVSSLLKRLSVEAPEKLELVIEIIQDMCINSDNWRFRSNVQEAIGFAIAKMDPYEAEKILSELPEFWARSNVKSEIIISLWKDNPEKAIDMIEEIEIAKVRAETVQKCAAHANLTKSFLSHKVIQKMYTICETLSDSEERFMTASKVLYTALRGTNEIGDPAVVDVIYSFLELFKSTTTEWLQFAYLYTAPFLRKHCEGQDFAELDDAILCPYKDANILISEWPRIIATSSV